MAKDTPIQTRPVVLAEAKTSHRTFGPLSSTGPASGLTLVTGESRSTVERARVFLGKAMEKLDPILLETETPNDAPRSTFPVAPGLRELRDNLSELNIIFEALERLVARVDV